MKRVSWILVALAAATCSVPSQAATINFFANLNGTSESPSNASPGSGAALVSFDDVAMTMSMQVFFTGLSGTVTAAHIHCCTAVANALTAGVATSTPTFPGFPSGSTWGTYNQTFDMTLASSYSAAFIAANGATAANAFFALLTGANASKAYLNIHSTLFSGGEIRGFLTPVAPVPLPAAAWLLIGGLGAVGAVVRKRRAGTGGMTTA